MNDLPLTGRVALVTGAASGIGRAAAHGFARRGASVVVSDIDEEGCQVVVEELQSSGGKAIAVAADISAEDDVVELIHTAAAWQGRLDCAYNNAGIGGQPARTAECTVDNWDRVCGVLLRGAFLCLKYELIQMLAQEPRSDGRRGEIVFTTSIASRVANRGMPAYVAAKHGVEGLIKTAALEYVRDGIRVNAVAPGATQTRMMEDGAGGDSGRLAQIAASQPGGRIADPAEIAGAAVWLCTDEASFITGATIIADNGATLGGTMSFVDEG